MTTKQQQLLSKISWFVIPFIISFFSWITVMIYNINTEVQVQKTKTEERKDIQEKIYERVEQNYHLLENKADETKNTTEHQYIINRLTGIEKKVDKVYRNVNYSYKPTMNFIPYKEKAICSNE